MKLATKTRSTGRGVPAFSCRAEVIKPGRMLTVVEAKVHSHGDVEVKLSATAMVTLAAVPAP